MTFVQALLTCESLEEAEAIASKLLEAKLIVCAKFIPAFKAKYWWKGSITTGDEVALIMETHESRMPKVEELVSSMHSYETFVLTAVPLVYVSKEARLWMQESLNLLGN